MPLGHLKLESTWQHQLRKYKILQRCFIYIYIYNLVLKQGISTIDQSLKLFETLRHL